MKPILFNTDMVRAILEGRKTVAHGNHGDSSPKDAFFHKVSLLSRKKISSIGSPKKSEMVKANSRDGL